MQVYELETVNLPNNHVLAAVVIKGQSISEAHLLGSFSDLDAARATYDRWSDALEGTSGRWAWDGIERNSPSVVAAQILVRPDFVGEIARYAAAVRRGESIYVVDSEDYGEMAVVLADNEIDDLARTMEAPDLAKFREELIAVACPVGVDDLELLALRGE